MDVDMERVAPPAGDEDLGRKKPPEEGTKPPQRMSFKDKLMGGKEKPPRTERVDLFDEGKMTVEYVDDNPMLPRIRVDKSVIESMCAPWTEALVVCLLGKRLGYRTMKAKLESTWRPGGGFDLMDVDNGFYLVTFDREEDKNKVIGGGPWMIFDHYLAVSTWSPEFISPVARVQRTLAWIRIPGLNVAFYDESFLLSVARVIGRPIKVDTTTLSGDRGRFARICVELDLTKAVIGRLCIEDFWYKVEYEGLHVICTKCGCYGHRSRECKGAPPERMKKPATTESSVTEKAGEGPTGTDSQSRMEEVSAGGKDTPAATRREMASGGPPSNAVNDGASIVADKTETESNPSASIPNIAANEVEILGDWMIVSKKKKKNTKLWGNDGGTVNGKSKANDELRKSRGLAVAQGQNDKEERGKEQRPARDSRSYNSKMEKTTTNQRYVREKSKSVGPFPVFAPETLANNSNMDWLYANNKKRRTRTEDGPGPLKILTDAMVFGESSKHKEEVDKLNNRLQNEGGKATLEGE
ncbi:uncharacterized protein LOC130719255 [Lotus japonicus]|uniref:uncharacterized protein LOC130719255 n=1 Tax=Lotus japonicus TaxID=34305 RepID=UPI002589C2B9|nr:uncharacterized protein LOC130719255 [Lotus japonicus]